MGLETLFISGLIASAGSQVLGGIAAKNQGDYEAAVARNNAVMAKQQSQLEAERTRKDTMRRLGAQKTAFGASGVTLSGSALDVASDSAFVGEQDAQLILYGGDVRQTQFLHDAGAAKIRGNQGLIAGLGGAAGTAMTGAVGFKSLFG